MMPQATLQRSKKWLQGYDKHIRKHSEWCEVLSDPTRAKILLILTKHKELCVSDIARIIKMSVSAVSHQLNLLQRSQLVGSEKKGRTVCYFLTVRNKKLLQCINFNINY